MNEIFYFLLRDVDSEGFVSIYIEPQVVGYLTDEHSADENGCSFQIWKDDQLTTQSAGYPEG